MIGVRSETEICVEVAALDEMHVVRDAQNPCFEHGAMWAIAWLRNTNVKRPSEILAALLDGREHNEEAQS